MKFQFFFFIPFGMARFGRGNEQVGGDPAHVAIVWAWLEWRVFFFFMSFLNLVWFFKAVRVALWSRSLSWTCWDFWAMFGSRTNGKRRADEDESQALFFFLFF